MSRRPLGGWREPPTQIRFRITPEQAARWGRGEAGDEAVAVGGVGVFRQVDAETVATAERLTGAVSADNIIGCHLRDAFAELAAALTAAETRS